MSLKMQMQIKRLLLSFTLIGILSIMSVNILSTTATPLRCFGKPPTITGTANFDTLTGTPGNDVIVGLDGDDNIAGLAGDDSICAGPGKDMVAGDSINADRDDGINFGRK